MILRPYAKGDRTSKRFDDQTGLPVMRELSKAGLRIFAGGKQELAKVGPFYCWCMNTKNRGSNMSQERREVWMGPTYPRYDLKSSSFPAL